MSNVVPVFVYGSLKQGFHNHVVMQQAQGSFVRDAVSKDRNFSLFSLGSFPALAYAEPGETPFFIKGELYEVPEHGVHVLDRLEAGYDKTQIVLDNGDVAFVYMLRPNYGTRLFPDRVHDNIVSWEFKRRLDF